MSRFNPHHPEFYPIRWITGARISLSKLVEGEDQSEWVSIDWARGEAGAVSRMGRIGAFRKGIKLYPEFDRNFGEALKKGFDIAISKKYVRGVWDVRICWKRMANKDEMLEILKKENGEDMQNTIDTLEQTP